jgi:hypothetical protein
LLFLEKNMRDSSNALNGKVLGYFSTHNIGGIMIGTIGITTPVAEFVTLVLTSHQSIFESYLLWILSAWGVQDAFGVLLSLILQPILGFERLSHYQEQYGELKPLYRGTLPLCGAQKLRTLLHRIGDSMLGWKLLLFQSQFIRHRASGLLMTGRTEGDRLGRVLDIDVTTVLSFAAHRKGAEPGFNRRYKGKPCFQFSASFIGKLFVDGKLFGGLTNPKVFFQQAVKRAIALGYRIAVVRADSAYGTVANFVFLEARSLGFAIGMPGTFTVVKDGKARLQRLARRKHASLLALNKGVTGRDCGWVEIAPGVLVRLMIIRRITRRKHRKTGKWKVKVYFYAIATNLDLTPLQLYRFYHARQRIEAGFRELKRHYALERLPGSNFKGNEFAMLCKMVAMTLVKLFQYEMLPTTLQSLLYKTLLRRVLTRGVRVTHQRHVEVCPKSPYRWALQRMLCKLARMKTALSP